LLRNALLQCAEDDCCAVGDRDAWSNDEVVTPSRAVTRQLTQLSAMDQLSQLPRCGGSGSAR